MLTSEDIEKSEDTRVRAMLNSDVAEMENIFAGSMLWVHASGAVDTKASMLEQFQNGRMRCFSLDRADVLVRIFGDVAVVTGQATMDAQVGELRKTAKSRYTGVWHLESGALKLVSWQSARI
jgi:ketosteroid isomerase-like protein